MAKKTEVSTETENTEIVAVGQNAALPTHLLGDDIWAGQGGFENTDTDSFAIPFLVILQKMSPMVDEDSSAYIEGAKAGMFFNTVTQELYDGKEGITIVPCAFKRSIIHWGGRESANPGFKGEIQLDEFELMKADTTQVVEVDGKYYKPDEDGKVDKKKNDLFADTRQHFVLVINPKTGEFSRALLSLTSTQIRASKSLMTALQNKKVKVAGRLRTPPTFANTVKMTTIGQSNEKGTWSLAKFELTGLVNDPDIFEDAHGFYRDVVGGEVNVDYTKADATSQTEEGEELKPTESEGF